MRRRGRMLVMAEYRKGLLLVYSSSSISGMGKAWVLLRKTEALPLARQTARPWYKYLILQVLTPAS